jgi:hypothetical protein
MSWPLPGQVRVVVSLEIRTSMKLGACVSAHPGRVVLDLLELVRIDDRPRTDPERDVVELAVSMGLQPADFGEPRTLKLVQDGSWSWIHVWPWYGSRQITLVPEGVIARLVYPLFPKLHAGNQPHARIRIEAVRDHASTIELRLARDVEPDKQLIVRVELLDADALLQSFFPPTVSK